MTTIDLLKLREENIENLQKMIRLLLQDLETGKRKSQTTAKTADTICKMIRTQSTLLCELVSNPEVKVYIQILQAGGSVPQQTLLNESEDFDSTWSAIKGLSDKGLINIKGERVNQKTLSITR